MEYIQENDIGEEIIRKLKNLIIKIDKKSNEGGNDNGSKFSDTLILR